MSQTTRPDQASLPDLGSELWGMVLAYLKQETLEPVKGLGRFLVFGVAGSLVGATGLVLLVVAGLRAMQEEVGAFGGAHSWIPYVVAGAGTVGVMGAAALRMLRGRS